MRNRSATHSTAGKVTTPNEAAENIGQEEYPLRVLVAPDSFKGSLDAGQAAAHIAAGIKHAIPGCTVRQAPIADGGEGTAQAVCEALGGTWHAVQAADANGDTLALRFVACRSAELGEFAIFDVAELVGLPHARLQPGQRTTRGVGQAVDAIRALGYETIVIGLGGSSTNDGGAGMLSTLGFTFVDAGGTVLDPVFDTLPAVHAVRRRARSDTRHTVRLIGLTDVGSPLTGPGGASRIFGPQKGFADTEGADLVLRRYAHQMEATVGIDFSMLPGAGAAGGLGFAIALLGGELREGAQFVLAALGIDERASGFDWIITGEGRSDAQTLLGKGPAMVAHAARRAGIPVTLLSGSIDYEPALEALFDGCLSLVPGPASLDQLMADAGPLLEAAARQLASVFAAGVRRGRRNGRDRVGSTCPPYR